MPWFFAIPEFLKKRACRYLLQHYLGQFLEEKISLDDLTVDLYNGTGTITNVPLNVEVVIIIWKLLHFKWEYVCNLDMCCKLLHVTRVYGGIPSFSLAYRRIFQCNHLLYFGCDNILASLLGPSLPSSFCVLQAIKSWSWRSPWNEATYSYPAANLLAIVFISKDLLLYVFAIPILVCLWHLYIYESHATNHSWNFSWDF